MCSLLDPIIDIDISPGAIVGGVLHSILCFILIFACMRYCIVTRRSKRRARRDSAARILQSAYSVDGQLGNSSDNPPSYEQCRLFSPNGNGSVDDPCGSTSALYSSSTSNNVSSFSHPSFLNSRQPKYERFENFSVSMVTEHNDRGQHNEPPTPPPPAYDSVMGALVIRVT